MVRAASRRYGFIAGRRLSCWILGSVKKGIGLVVVGMSHLGFTVSLGEHGAGRWMVTHEHVSVPIYMDGSVKAAVDLKP